MLLTQLTVLSVALSPQAWTVSELLSRVPSSGEFDFVGGVIQVAAPQRLEWSTRHVHFHTGRYHFYTTHLFECFFFFFFFFCGVKIEKTTVIWFCSTVFEFKML